MDCCGNCRFFELIEEENGAGICRRYPPRAFIIAHNGGETSTSVFPPMHVTKWCGEYKTEDFITQVRVQHAQGNA
jgi:hypothetical protein